MTTRTQLQFAERLRRKLRVSPDVFSLQLGYSATAYRMALRRKRISRWMMAAIERLAAPSPGGAMDGKDGGRP